VNPEHPTDFSSNESELFSYLLENEGVLGYQPLSATPDSQIALSFGQQRLWYLEQLNPGSALYNIRFTLRLKGKLHIDALRSSLQAIIRRHEILRTTFEDPEGTPWQVIHAELLLPLPIHDLRGVAVSERQQRAEELIQQDAQTPFDLSALPLLRAHLLQLEDEKWLLLFTFHHIIFDGWSLRIFFKELSHCYQAYLKAEEPTLAPLPMQYADYAIWQRKQEQEGIYASQRAYWQKQLQGVPTLLDLPRDYPRPALSNFIGEKLPVRVDLLQTERLRTLARQEDCSLYMVILAIWLTLLYRYSGQDEMVIGTLIANRTNTETEQLIGFLANTLALRIFVGDDPIFREMLRRVREVALDAYEHQDLPFEQVVSLAHPSRETNHMPLVQVMFAFQNTTRLQVHLPGLESEYERQWTETAKFDLILDLVEDRRGLHGVLEYSTELFARERMQRMVGHLDTLFGIVTGIPQQRLSDLPLLTETEKHQLIMKWNQTQVDYPQGYCLHQLFEAQVERSPQAIALTSGETQMTYRELNQQANQLAHYLQKLGVGPGTLVGLCLERSLAAVVGMLAILKAGGAYVPLDPGYPAERLAFMLQAAQIPVLVTQQRWLQQFQATSPQTICLDTDWTVIAQQPTENPTCAVNAEDLVYLIYTSGSTGQPKGAGVYHRGFVNLLHWFVGEFGLTSQDRGLLITSVSFDLTQKNIFAPLIIGATLHLMPSEYYDVQVIAQTIREKNITLLNCTPSAFYPFVEDLDTSSFEQLQSLRYLFLGGEAISLRRLQNWRESVHFHAEIVNTYGPTECSDVVAFYRLNQREAFVESSVPLGKPIANTQLFILDEHLHLLPVGAIGELYIAGSGLGAGYINDPALSATRFPSHPFSARPGERLYKTGDLARYLSDGNIEFLGRQDYQIKLRGFRIEPGEIEARLESHPAVRQSVVIVHEDSRGQKRLVAYFVPAQEQCPSVEDLRAHLQRCLPAYMIPTTFIMLAALPLTLSGKVNYQALPDPLLTGDGETELANVRPESSSAYVSPRNEMEQTIVPIWEEYLGIKAPGVYDRFDELGGDSLMVLQIIARLYNIFLVRLSVRDFMTGPTVANVAATIQKRLEQQINSWDETNESLRLVSSD
jgi:amino acid adenylation domain-containing protein